MFLDLSDQSFDVFFLGYIGWDTNSTTRQTFLIGKIVQTFDCLVDALFAGSLTCADEKCLSSGQQKCRCCMQS